MYVACSKVTTAAVLFIIAKKFIPTTAPDPKDDIAIELKRLETVKLKPKFYEQRLPCTTMKIISNNVQSLNAHVTHITNDQVYMTSDIILLSETWTTENQQFDIPGFTEIARVNITELTSSRAYGAMCLVNDKLNQSTTFKKIQLLNTSNEGSISIAGFTSPTLPVLSVYISPKFKLDDALPIIESCISNNKRIILAGDFNVDFNIESSARTKLLQLLDIYNMHTAMPDDMKSTTNNGTFIDNVFTNFTVQEGGRYISFTSYHDPLYITF
ncbi:hypothetical protein INT47_012071 [Mucor saturninus]|uniref:Endonuclease/exonuclease/phosphatase domain-containing protein n=1 Tax=Mucor saturninus TaxID=64648 RepID=A0A8H7UY43_9FUNG|nr:hypothetical protein INT47_012071 [Mucor saturninus]